MKTDPYNYEVLSNEVLEKMNEQRLTELRKKMLIIDNKLQVELDAFEDQIEELQNKKSVAHTRQLYSRGYKSCINKHLASKQK